MYLIFKKTGEFVMAGQPVPASHSGDDYQSATLPEGEEFDPSYSYTLGEDGVPVKGDKIPVDADEVARMEAVFQATRYRTERRYPPIGDQLDALFHAGVFPDDMTAQIQAVKDANPKPEGE